MAATTHRRLRRLAVGSVLALGSLAVAPGSAAAAITCTRPPTETGPNGSILITNPVSNIGCVTTSHGPGLATRYVEAVADTATGWTYTVRSVGGGTSNRVVVEFRKPADRRTRAITYSIAPGRVVIK
ncbi:MAG: hypothetical protein RI958_3231 [Actinomycetota bacterium]